MSSITVRADVSIDTYQRLDAITREQERPRAQLVRMAVERMLAEHEARLEPPGRPGRP